MHVEGIGFDYGNTLVSDPFGEVLRLKGNEFSKILKESGYNIPKARIIEAWSDVNMKMNYPYCSHFAQEIPLIQTALEKLGVDKKKRRALANQLLTTYRTGFKQVIRNDYRIHEVKRVLDELRKRGKKLIMLSNEKVDTLNMQLRWTGLGEFFQKIIVSEREGVEKPDPMIFTRMVKEFDLPKDMIAYVGDDPSRDIRPAKESGIKAVWLKQPEGMSIEGWRDYKIKLKKKEKPDAEIGNLFELTEIIK